MNTVEIKKGLQDLINRLFDAEKGYREIIKATSIPTLKGWMKRYATERQSMREDLVEAYKKLGGSPEVSTTLIGDMHRAFIDIKVNGAWDNFESIVTEIERGASTLISDYEDTLKEVKMPAHLVTLLNDQKLLVENELRNLIQLKKDLASVEV
ncbi:MAG: PA2169 family four-helix-bundle protein [Saprospiraceae bacterium]|nr:PA2169 family four-helix-bundle protein [Saprospiraceae bacterium]